MAENEPKDQNDAPEEQPEQAPEQPVPEPADESAPEPEASESPSDEDAQDDQASALAEEALKAAQQAIADMAEEADTAAGGGAKAEGVDPSRFEPPDIEAAVASGDVEGIDLLSDVNLHVKIELGRTRMFVEDVLRLRDGAVVELDKLAGDPVDIYVNDRPVARGEVLILNDNFCVRVNEILPTAKPD